MADNKELIPQREWDKKHPLKTYYDVMYRSARRFVDPRTGSKAAHATNETETYRHDLKNLKKMLDARLKSFKED